MQRRSSGLGAVLFTDIVGSTPIAAEMGNTRWSELVGRHHRIVRRLIGRFGGHEIDTAGDGFFVTFERPADAIRCAVAATEEVRELGIEIRAGVAFGELETAGRKPSGLVVNTAARVMAVAGPGEVLVPASVREIVPGGGISFADHGVHRLKGLDDEFRLFSVTGVDGHEVEPPLEETQAVERRREIFPTGARRWAPLLIGVGAGVVGLIVIASLLVARDRPASSAGPRGPFENAVAVVAPDTGKIVSSISVGPSERRASFASPEIAAGEGAVWLLRPPNLFHVDPVHAEVRPDPIQLGFANSHTLMTGFDAVWVAGDGSVYRVNPATDERDVFLVLPPTGGISTYPAALTDVLWAATSSGLLVRMDPRIGSRDQVDTGISIDTMTATKDAVWLADVLAGTVTRFDPDSMRRVGRPLEVGGTMDELIASDDSLWVLDRAVGLVTRIDVGTGRASSTRVGDDPTDMEISDEAVWVGDLGGSLYRIDPTTLQTERLSLGAEVLGVAISRDDGSLWVYVGATTGSD